MIRFCDIVLSCLGLLLLSPLFAVVAVWIVIDNPGPIFYRQMRVGKDGKDFGLLKFRSMRVGADKSSLITIGEHDSRITRAGYYIRKYKLDELPQLWNVLVGDMSLVGPRPEVRKYVDMYTREPHIGTGRRSRQDIYRRNSPCQDCAEHALHQASNFGRVYENNISDTCQNYTIIQLLHSKLMNKQSSL